IAAGDRRARLSGLDAGARDRASGVPMAGAAPFRLARAARRLVADPLRGEGARSRAHPGLSALRAAGPFGFAASLMFPDGREFFRPWPQIFNIYKRFSDI